MKREVFRLINKIKNRLTELEDEDINHPILDSIWEDLTELEDIIYDTDESYETDEESYD